MFSFCTGGVWLLFMASTVCGVSSYCSILGREGGCIEEKEGRQGEGKKKGSREKRKEKGGRKKRKKGGREKRKEKGSREKRKEKESR